MQAITNSNISQLRCAQNLVEAGTHKSPEIDRRVCGLVIELLTWRLGTLLNLVVVAGGDCRETHLKPKPTT
jgi:hypothetical protein